MTVWLGGLYCTSGIRWSWVFRPSAILECVFLSQVTTVVFPSKVVVTMAFCHTQLYVIFVPFLPSFVFLSSLPLPVSPPFLSSAHWVCVLGVIRHMHAEIISSIKNLQLDGEDPRKLLQSWGRLRFPRHVLQWVCRQTWHPFCSRSVQFSCLRQKMLRSNINLYRWHPFYWTLSLNLLDTSINYSMNQSIRWLLACDVFWDIFKSQQL